MAEIKLDKSQPFGTVHPPENDAHFHQDGFYFNADGKIVEGMLDEGAKAKLAKRLARIEASKRQEEIYREELAKQGLDEKEIAEAISETKQDGANVVDDPNKIDLVAWATGRQKYVFGQVRKAFQDQYSVAIMDKKTGLEWLVDEGHIEHDEIKI